MTTGRSTVSSCAACAPLAGNPSDRYGGALVAMPLTDLTAMAALREAGGEFTHRSSDPELVAIVEATVATYAERGAELPPVELSLSTNIPPGVGLGRTAALVIATLRSLAAFDGRRSWPADDLAATALAVLHGLGADAAPGDVLVQAHARPLSMTFGPDVVEPLALPDELAPFVAWSADDTTAIGASIDAAPRTSQRSLRRRFEGGDPDVVAAMGELRVQAGRARRGILSSDVKLLADAMHRTLAVRLRITDVSPTERRLIEIGRSAGAVVNCTGSGRSVIGLARHAEHLEIVAAAYESAGARVITLA